MKGLEQQELQKAGKGQEVTALLTQTKDAELISCTSVDLLGQRGTETLQMGNTSKTNKYEQHT